MSKRVHPILEKDIQRFEKYCMPDTNSGCWLWSGWSDRNGYGRMRVGNVKVGRRTVFTHRFSYTLHKGDIPEGLVIDHLCKNTNCCNPDHLEAVTTRENVLRSTNFAAKKAKQKACKRGHLFTQENTYIPPKGGRVCRECMRHHDRRRNRKALWAPKGEPSHCKKGHEFTSKTSWIDPRGNRQCRICNAAKARNYRMKKAAEKKIKLNSF